MKRRDALEAVLACLLATVLLIGCATSPERKLLFFTRNVGYYHDVVKRQGKPLSPAEEVLVELGRRIGVEVVCTKDGRIFDKSLDPYAAIAFYTNNDLTKDLPTKVMYPGPLTEGRYITDGVD